MEATYEPRSIEPPVHFHPRQEERFEIFEGTMQAESMASGGAAQRRHPHRPAGTPHSMWNTGDVPARTRWETRPALRTEYFFETVSRLVREGNMSEKGVPNPLQLAVIATAFRDEVRTTKPPQALQGVLLPPLALVGRLLGYRA
jgi:hypothetical protein